MQRVIDIVRTRGITRRSRPLVVLSACAGVTNALIEIAELAVKEKTAAALASIDALEARHARIARDIIEDEERVEDVQHRLRTIWEDIRILVRGIHLLHELTPKTKDQIQSAGERASTLIFHAALEEQLAETKTPVHLYDAREFFVTSSEFTAARPIVSEITRQMKRIGRDLSKGAVGVTQGFVGRTLSGETTTIGRGGSDFSAAIQGVALDADEIQIWTDVAGIMTCDPRIAPAAWTIDKISFHEASELAFFGAKVLHPETIWPAVEKGIPVLVLSSREPEKHGTVIVESADQEIPITGIAVKRSIVLARIPSKTAVPDAALQQAIWQAFSESGTAMPLAVSLSVDSALIALNDSSAVPILRKACEGIATIEVETDRSLITLVGRGLRNQAGVAVKIFRALGRTNCEMISYGGSETAFSLAVHNDVASRTVKRLHAEFFE